MPVIQAAHSFQKHDFSGETIRGISGYVFFANPVLLYIILTNLQQLAHIPLLITKYYDPWFFK